VSMKGRYVVRISAADVGQRITVRSQTHACAGQPLMTDTVGVLRSWSGGLLEIERRDGTIVTIAEVDLVAARVIPRRESIPTDPD
jgi:N-acetylglutamate synthase